MKSSTDRPQITSPNHITEIRELLPSGVLVPVPPNTKRPVITGWPSITFEQTQEPAFKVARKFGDVMTWIHYASELARGNIAVALGKQSGGLCTIDIDNDGGVEPFLALNPWANDTLITKRQRGCNIWFYVDGPYPKSKPVTTLDGRAWGEFRADGNVTMIHGQAQDKKKGETAPIPYRRLKNAKPAQIAYRDIAWPEGVVAPKLEIERQAVLEESNPTLTNPPSTERLYSYQTEGLYTYTASTESKLECMRRQMDAEEALEKHHPGLKELYTRYLEPKFRNTPGGRNGFLVHNAPMLFRAVGESVFVLLMSHFYECNSSFFTSTRQVHEREVQAALAGVKETYLNELSPDERGFYQALRTDRQRDAFRICRDLALRPKDAQREPPQFFLSGAHLAHRLGLHDNDKEGWRLLEKFQSWGVLKLLKKGEVWKRGEKKAPAGFYEWCLPVPARTANAGAAEGLNLTVLDNQQVVLTE